MSQLLAQGSLPRLIQQIGALEAGESGSNPRSNFTSPLTLLPILTSKVVDELLVSFGFSPYSRPHLIKRGWFPRGVAVHNQRMSGVLYPTLVVDLIAALAARSSKNYTRGQAKTKEEILTVRLKEEITELTTLDLFQEVIASLDQYLPVGQPLTLAAITHLFQPNYRLDIKNNEAFVAPRPARLDWSTWEKWYRLAALQEKFRGLFFEAFEGQDLVALSPAFSLKALNPVAAITLGVVDGKAHSGPTNSSVVLTHSASEGELGFSEELELPDVLLERLGCDWVDAPVARLEALRDLYFTRLIFYLPALHSPFILQKLESAVDFLAASATAPFGSVEGFERPWDENTPGELIGEVFGQEKSEKVEK